jgi:hypothetical protein
MRFGFLEMFHMDVEVLGVVAVFGFSGLEVVFGVRDVRCGSDDSGDGIKDLRNEGVDMKGGRRLMFHSGFGFGMG